MKTTEADTQKVRERILADESFNEVAERARALLKTGLNAGARYPEIWIRDLATFINTAAEVAPAERLREALICFFDFQQDDGGVIDGYSQRKESVDDYSFISCAKHPELAGHKNTVATDQEASLVLAVHSYVHNFEAFEFLDSEIDGFTVLQRLERAMDWVFLNRFDSGYELIWTGTTIDWGDIQPEHPWGVEWDENSHPAIGIYANAFHCIALEKYISLLRHKKLESCKWEQRLEDLRKAIRKHLWQADRPGFVPHIYLGKGSPFPEDFDESPIYFHGGTATAMQAGVLSREEALACYQRMKENVAAAGAQTVGLTLWPLYNVPTMPNRHYYLPFEYQNGGDWPWWGARVAHGLLDCGCPAEAYEALQPMVQRVIDRDGFYEWHSPDGTPHGNNTFRGAAGIIEKAIGRLRAWADKPDKALTTTTWMGNTE